MKHFRYVFILGLVATFAIPVQAQISLGALKRQAERSVEKAIEKKVEKEIDKAAQKAVNKYWDRVLGKYYQDVYETSEDKNGEPVYPCVMSSNVKTRDSYSFDHLLKMKMDTYKSNGKLDETVFIYTHTNQNGNYLGTEIESNDKSAENMFIINDFDNESMVMLTEENGQKQSISFSFGFDEEAASEITDDNSKSTSNDITTYKEIGTKVILGYKCKGYLREDDENISEVWISEEPIKGMEKAAAMLAKNKKVDLPSGYPKGSLMETTVTDKKTKEKFIMRVIEINTDSKVSYNMANYPNVLGGK